jgi:hypothetical protein
LLIDGVKDDGFDPFFCDTPKTPGRRYLLPAAVCWSFAIYLANSLGGIGNIDPHFSNYIFYSTTERTIPRCHVACLP